MVRAAWASSRFCRACDRRHGPRPRCRTVSSSVGEAKLRSAGVQGTFPLVELRLAGVDSLVPRRSDPVPLISDLIAPVSNEIALVSGPPALVVA